jgi:hypothetical protein
MGTLAKEAGEGFDGLDQILLNTRTAKRRYH